ncbi:MAG: hypothetical protein Q8P39_00635 [Candidatus Yanofskybacteria bacterium]|nr:hypothetical protein [Candidatus Yanofskybacteria bacterium]
MPQVVYRSEVDYDFPGTLWAEEGELPSCVDPYRLGTFICSCGQHEVRAAQTKDPLDGKDRIAIRVLLM